MRRPLLAMMLLLLVPLAQAGTAENPEITDADDVAEDSPFSSYDAIDVLKGWVESESPTSFVFAVQMAGTVEGDAPTGTDQELRYTLKLTYNNIEVPTTAQIIDGALSGAEATDDILRFTVSRDVWADVRPGQPLTNIGVETKGWTVSSQRGESTDTAPDEAGTALDYIVGTLAEPGMDYDNDGIDDRDEVAGTTDPANPDTDLDGLNDGDELDLGTDPNNPDSDGDGLLDGDEVTLGSDPLKADSDDDGLTDKQEIDAGTNPTVADSDGDGIHDGDEVNTHGTDPTKADSDGDGIDDQDELDNALDPTDESDGLADHDGDGVSTADELAAGTDPFVSDLQDEGLTAEGPGGLPWWLWLVIAAFVVIVIVLIFWFAALARRQPEEEEDDVPEDEHEVIEMEEGEGSKYEPLVIDEAYLTEGLEPEQIQRARRLFEERERRYLDQAYPGRTREFDEELPDVADDKKAIKGLEREQRLREREQAKAAKLAAKEAAREAKLQARFQKELAKAEAKKDP